MSRFFPWVDEWEKGLSCKDVLALTGLSEVSMPVLSLSLSHILCVGKSMITCLADGQRVRERDCNPGMLMLFWCELMSRQIT